MKTRVGRVETLLVCLIIIVLSCYFWDSSRSLLPGSLDIRTSTTKLSNEQTFQTIAKDEKARHDSDNTLPLPGPSHTEERQVFLEPTTRSSLKKHGARVACWPSSGGIWIKQADIVDMEFLGLDRFQDTPKQSNQTAEDNFCAKLKMTGADWWQLPLELVDPEQELCKTLETCFAPDIVNEYLIAWPETTETACYVSIALAEKRGGGLLNGYRNAMDMGERCGIITRLGGKECRYRAECPELDYLDWGSQDLENQGYDTPPVAVDLGLLDEIFDPKPTREVLRWANQFCERNGWRRII